ncbi:3-oxo-tetronate kinase [Rhizobium indigoferae]|uniref:3-oxo-tetronate kinase n=1 Tax=Rhizobium indigoferae TaxID=158891 RepID=A0ABZ0ZDM0_9HYPH|nr:3-oxo-tetronate kinase [Rhizobium indigoferae]NNU56168.1 four-carbon acid sugar kinase family protein [Rhizobium indigoferae]WQN37713.1 four-carbon acid sugar kinase family protein [Rhizobium indigoferae]GLR59303.1 HPr kinase [Rhizobium indigoferae]
MATFFGAIADDFTGATDLAGLLARSGVPVSLRMGVPTEPPENTAPLEIIALKCRTSPVQEAVHETQAALEWLKAAGAQRFFWKYCSTFDSTAKGNIGPVAENLMAALGVDQTIYCPAFPENGRAIFMGNLFVGEQPLAESPMKDHPLTPMRDSNLTRLLATQVTKPVGLANRLVVAKGAASLSERLSKLAADGIAHVVVDAVANDDLYIIAEACQDMTLLTGGSAVAMPLPELWAKQGRVEKSTLSDVRSYDAGPAIVLSGSCSSMTNKQVADFLEKGGPSFRLDPLEIAEAGNAKVLNWLASQYSPATTLIYATAAPDAVRAAQDRLGVERAGYLIEETLAACAAEARDSGYRRFVVAGGETSGAVTKALGITRLNIGVEIAPGVPWCFASSHNAGIAITLKSGNFGNEQFFSKALEVLEP